MLPAATSILLTIALVHLVHPLRAAALLDPAPDIARSHGVRKIADEHPEREPAAKFEDFEPAASRRDFPVGPPVEHNVAATPPRSRSLNYQEETKKSRRKREPQKKRRLRILPLLCG